MGALDLNIQNFKSLHAFPERLVPVKIPAKSVLVCIFSFIPPILRIISTLKDF